MNERLERGLVLKETYNRYTIYIWQHPESYHYCGYVEVPKESVYFGKHYDSSIYDGIEVHGGLTFSNQTDADTFMIGFDCSHYGDYNALFPQFGGHKWSIDEVLAEVISLAKQLERKEKWLTHEDVKH